MSWNTFNSTVTVIVAVMQCTHVWIDWQACMGLEAITTCRAEMMTRASDGSTDQPSTSGSAPADFTHVTHVAVKAMCLEKGDNEQLAKHEGQVLASLNGKGFVPRFHGHFTDPETQHWHRRAYILTE